MDTEIQLLTGLCAGVQGVQGVSLHSAGLPCPALHQLTGPAGGTRASDMITAAILTILQSTTQIAIIAAEMKYLLNFVDIAVCIVKIRRGSGKDRQGMAVKAIGLKA